MKIQNQKGEIITVVAITLAVLLGLVFYPNNLSKAMGVQNKQNKIVQKEVTREKIVPVIMVNGKQATNVDGSPQFKTVETSSISDSDEQQHVTLWEQFTALPGLFILFIILGVCGFPPAVIALKWVWARWTEWRDRHDLLESETKTMVNSMDDAFATIPLTLAGESLPGEINRAALAEKIKKNMLNILSTSYDQSTKDLVRELRA